MTSGGPAGTSGEGRRKLDLSAIGPWMAIAGVGVIITLVNATSVLIDWRREGMTPGAAYEPFLWEFTSLIGVLALAPLVGWAIKRWPVTPQTLWPNAAVHLALTVPFCLAHVAVMVALRMAVYALLSRPYDYFAPDATLIVFYEWRKDVLTYALVAGVYWLFEWLRARAVSSAASRQDGEARLELKDGAATVFLQPRDILWLEAAGNYVEVHTASRTHLVRATLGAYEQHLASQGFVRVHRSRVVNRSRITEIRPTPAGDFELVLDTGAKLIGSRRFRAGLADVGATTAPAARA